MASPFTDRPPSMWVARNELAFALRDAYPVSPGHTLVIPFREVATWFEATVEEQGALLALVDVVKRQLDEELRPDGYNVGFNAGLAAGQTVMHLHVHVIPRFTGDVPDPRGGVRHVIPGKGNYLAASPLATGGTADPFLAHVLPLFDSASRVSLVAAFVQDSGLTLLSEAVHALLARSGTVRLVTGDYLAITQVAALERLLSWTVLFPAFEARVVETARLTPSGTAFHPKSWLFEGPGVAVGFVGSSNISRSALAGGIEWNLRTDRALAPEAWTRLTAAFDALWTAATPLTAAWLADYESRARLAYRPLPPGEEVAEPLAPVPLPHTLQREGLEALKKTRKDGRGRALVVMATGLGKTWLAAFDLAQMCRELGRFPRTLFVAHRAEILEQAADTFRRIARGLGGAPRLSWYAGSDDDLSGQLVFAMVQKLERPAGLERLAAEHFDYVVVDEVHHAAAASYRRILNSLDADFLLGLTATPDRADEADVLGFFDDNVPYRASLGEGMRFGLLTPFAYHGLKDTVDYKNIPWRGQQFAPEALARAAATEARMERLWEAWKAHGGTRTLVFCCSVAHAEFTRSWLSDRGVRCACITAKTPPAQRSTALAELASGELSALCSVDLFNEGVDLPAVDRVVMLRPTESPVLFLQQLGRGLRLVEGKDLLTVLDFVGNHRVFLDRIRLLLSLSSRELSVREFLSSGLATDLPPGCSVNVELEAIEMLRFLLPIDSANEVVRAYRELRAARGVRPKAGELYRMGALPSRVRPWFPFVGSEGDLTPEESTVLGSARDWFEDLESTHTAKSFKLVVLEVLLDADALGVGLPLDELAARSHAYLVRSPELRRDIEGITRLPDPLHPDPKVWRAYWRENPISAWTEGKDRKWFRVEGERLLPRLPIPTGLEETFTAMTRELVDYRIAKYRGPAETGPAFTCDVTWNQKDPILMLPSRSDRSTLPEGETDVRLPDGSVWQFFFRKVACNVAWPAGKARNELPDLLRTWFGPYAGQPGRSSRVRFSPSPDGLWVAPQSEVVAASPRASRVACYPSLRAAAGASSQDSYAEFGDAGDTGASEVRLPLAKQRDRLFAVRASGSSMDGGKDPIRDGDWVVLQWERGGALKNMVNRVALVETSDVGGESGFQLKRIVREQGSWLLRSDNPAVNDFEPSERTVPIAVHVQTVRPEDLAPAVGSPIPSDGLSRAFGFDLEPLTGRVEGHLFVFVNKPGSLTAPDRVVEPIKRLPGETAFVLARADADGQWRYCGVGRWVDDESAWAIPYVDWPTWRALGHGRSASRRLPDEFRVEAERFVDSILAKVAGSDAWLRDGGKPLRVLGRSAEGGVMIDGGEDGFEKRTVSLIDIAWVLAAERDVRENGGVLDEARVNRLRYLEGTPKGSTRWIDTGHAVRLMRESRESS